MRAVRVERLGAIGNGRLVDLPEPVPGPEEVAVAVHAAPVNFVDLVTITGRYQFTPALPYTPGKGPAGVVTAVGAAVHDLHPGDRVLAMAEYGGYAETAIADHRQVYRLPDEVSFAAAAAMAVSYDTAWVALRERARLQPGERVLVLGGTSAVGQAAIQLARALGAADVLATASSDAKAARVYAAGADAVIDITAEDLRESIRDQVFAALDGEGVDVVIDPLGGDVFDGAIRALAWRGRLVSVGFAAGRIPELRLNYLLLKNIEVSGMQISDYRRRTPDLLRRAFEEMFAFVVEGKLRPPTSRVLPLESWQEALGLIDTRQATERLVLVPRGSGA